MDLFSTRFRRQPSPSVLRTPRQLRWLFVDLLVNDCVPAPMYLWTKFHHELSLDYILEHATDALGENRALAEMQDYLGEHGKSLEQFGLLSERAAIAAHQMNNEQLAIFTEIVTAAMHDQDLLLFIDGKAGRGKTATAAFAALLYAGGRTTHSTFKVRAR
ncbi:hypothetical protein FA95DRAFT_1567802 [Auriscalpium vulgare]|uniref:Uncharacterized protein n=1 Tax=Auriscalpium vulgare TaxID=40419 RepID=A0ACB8R2X8_9AGAM|nr:hypothetical protein FA95DRAFT_1567802 [Auriscalpium vulgare]